MEDALRRRARENPSEMAAVMADRSGALSYAALDTAADGVAAALQARGLLPGETVAILHENHSVVLPVWWGARRTGLYYVPLSTRQTAVEIASILDACSARAIVVSDGCAELAAAAAPDNLHRFTTGTAEGFEHLTFDRPAHAPSVPTQVGRELIFSSGTTGRPKGIRRPLAPSDNDVLPSLERRMRQIFRIDRQSIYLSVSPLHHATGRFLWRVIEEGGTCVILPRFEPVAALEAIGRHRVTHSQWVPTMFVRLLDLPEAERQRHDLSSHRVALHAAAPCPVAVKRAMIDWWGPIVDEYYGGTENAGVTFIGAGEWLSHPGSVGRSIGGEIHIVADDGSGRELGPGELGQIFFEGGVPFAYMGQLGTEMDMNTPSGWTSYGDLGHLDADGFLYISDRRNDLIITGGVNIYPKEVELVLEAHPAVSEAAVIGIVDPEYGQRVEAVVVPAAKVAVNEGLDIALIAYCREGLASVKCPRAIHFQDELPRNENGKLLKRALRQDYEGTRQ